MKQTIAMFCYRKEEELLPLTIHQTRIAMPMASIHLFDDANDPLPEKIVAQLTEMAGVHYSKTTFDRGRNLNGPDCVRGILQCLTEAADADGNTDGVIIKMDPDTIILRAAPLLDVLSKGAEWVSHNSMQGHFAGMFYVMHRSILDTVRKNARVIDVDPECAEDETIGALCYLAAMKRRYVWTDVSVPGNRRFFAAFPVDSMRDDASYRRELDFVAREGCIITVGNTQVAGMPSSYRTRIMIDLLESYMGLNVPKQEENKEGQPQATSQAPGAIISHPPCSADIPVTPRTVTASTPMHDEGGGVTAGFRVEDDDDDK